MKRKIENMPFDVEEYINIEYPTIDPDWVSSAFDY